MKLSVGELRSLIREAGIEHTHVHRDARKSKLVKSLLDAQKALNVSRNSVNRSIVEFGEKTREHIEQVIQEFEANWTEVQRSADRLNRFEETTGEAVTFSDEVSEFREEILDALSGIEEARDLVLTAFSTQANGIDFNLKEIGVVHDWMLDSASPAQKTGGDL